jgi:hypothetical protein
MSDEIAVKTVKTNHVIQDFVKEFDTPCTLSSADCFVALWMRSASACVVLFIAWPAVF